MNCAILRCGRKEEAVLRSGGSYGNGSGSSTRSGIAASFSSGSMTRLPPLGTRCTGYLNIPQTYKTKGGHSLGLWILIQRAVRKGLQWGVLSEERIAKLGGIRMCWTVREQDRWPEYFAAAETHAAEFGHLCVL